MPRGNPKFNPSEPAPYEPTDAERAVLKRTHGLGWHVKGGWCKRFPGERNRSYFGKVPPAEAIDAYGAAKRARAEGERLQPARLTVAEAVDLFVAHLDRQLADGKIGVVQRASYGDELLRMADVAGRRRSLSDFCKLDAPDLLFRPIRASAMARGVFAAEKHVVQVRTFLDWCSRVRRYVAAPFYGDEFDAPTEREKRAARKATRKEKGVAHWTPAEVRQVVDAARADGPHRHAQILLMLNGGMGSSDVSHLEDGDVDWERACIHTDRSKTLVPRVVPLWPETLEAMRASRAERPAPARPEWATRFFLTPQGRPLVLETLAAEGKRAGRTTNRTDSLRNWFYRLVNPPEGEPSKRGRPRTVPALPHLKRHGAGAYTLRSVFLSLSMGHGSDANLEAVILGQQFPRPIVEFYLRGDLREKLAGITLHVRSQIWPGG